MFVLLAFVVFSSGRAASTAPAPPVEPSSLLVVLSDTGRTQGGRPIVEPTDAPDHLSVLTSGYSGRVLRLYLLAQRFTRPERDRQPAYLVLSNNQGGFPRVGFVFEGKDRPDVSFVDLHRRSPLTGRAGAMDQIFPHELMHMIVATLAGDPPEGHASQVHAVGVRTDRVTAFNEGFAEHAQLMAIEDPEARPETRALAADAAARDWAFRQFDAYRRAISARWAIAPKARLTFPLWFSRAEQILRYHGVKENLFARQPHVPERLLSQRGAYQAYLLENTLPGTPASQPKSAARLLASEGWGSALFYRLVNAPSVQRLFREEAFYRRFGSERHEIAPLENAYLKIFAAIREGGYDASAIVEAYARLFPEERAVVTDVLRETMLGQAVPHAPEIWLLNERFTAGTTLFDQYRALPRPHTFDLNAASAVDLASVPHVDRPLARAILAAAPYAAIDDLQRVPGMSAAAMAALRDMHRAMQAPPPAAASEETTLSISSILMPYVWRALTVWLVCACVGAACYRAVRRLAWWRVALNALAATLIGLAAGWTLDGGTGLVALAAPVAAGGLPAAVITLWRSKSGREAGHVLLAWTLVSLPAALAVVPL